MRPVKASQWHRRFLAMDCWKIFPAALRASSFGFLMPVAAPLDKRSALGL